MDIYRILKRIGWPIKLHEFYPPYDLPHENDISQLVAETIDGFPAIEEQAHYNTGHDPPFQETFCDPPHGDDASDSPHWSD